MSGDATPSYMSYGARLAHLGETRGDDLALVYVSLSGASQTFSWRQLDDRSNQIASRLAADGTGVGSRVGIQLRNSPDHVLVALAIWKLGAVPVPIRWDLPAWELERVMAVLEPQATVHLESPCLLDTLDAPTDAPPDAISPHASGVLSSGSTGSPKVILRLIPGVYLPGSSSNRLIEDYAPLGPQLVLVPAPLYHSNGFMSLTNLLGGDRLLLLERFDTGILLQAIEDHRVTGMVATTVMLQRLARDPDFDRRDLSSLDWVMHGAAPLPDWLARVWIERIGAERFYVCYGSSEGAGATFARGDEYLEHPGTVGRGAMATDLRILDDEGRQLPPGEIGHVYMKSAHGILASYVGDVPPIQVNDDGYATVGDLGWLDDDGYLYLADRRVDMIITGGANVFPAEVEAALSEHPDVADVVVIGLADEEWGRRVHAVIQRRDGSDVTADDLTAYVGERLARYKVPKTLEFVDQIPRTEATKVNRASLVAERETVSS